jgi:hypothetical protein
MNRLDAAFTAPSARLVAITPSDSTNLSPPTRYLYVGGAGDLAVKALDDTAAVTLKAVPVGTLIPVRAVRVMATNTTATNIVGLI